MNHSILIVLAHPDDESCLLGGTIAKYSREGIPVDLVCATRGEKGSRLGIPNDIDTGTAREEELRKAADILGIRSIHFLGYLDTKLAAVNAAELADRIAGTMKELRPEVVVTFGPDGVSGHSDHIAVGKAATAAFEKLREETGEPRKLYYIAMPESTFPQFRQSGVVTRPDVEIGTAINITAYLAVKLRAIAIYKSQQDTHRCFEIMRKNRKTAVSRREFFCLAGTGADNNEVDLLQ